MGYIIEAILIIVLCIGVFNIYKKHLIKSVQFESGQKKYFQLYYNLLMKWKENEQEGKTIAQKIRGEGYKKVAVYGMKKIGWILCNDLMRSGIEVSYAIDRDAEKLSCNAFSNIPDVNLNLPNDELDKVDLIIVTALQSYSKIKSELENRYSYKVISLEELIDSL